MEVPKLTEDSEFDYSGQTLVVVNRGEIALRVLRTAKALGVYAIAVYTSSDARAPHVLLADDSIPLLLDANESEATAYLSIDHIVSAIQAYNEGHKGRPISLVHPGYGFLSENPNFASQIISKTGATWLGPRTEVIAEMGLKHVARQAAIRSGVPVVPGSDGLLIQTERNDSTSVLNVARKVGFPIMLKATAGGGGMGLVICKSEDELVREFGRATQRAKALFNEGGVFLERYLSTARHIEIQVFGNGLGEVVHMAERECSIQRRHQKIIEETPSPFLEKHPDLRKKMCDAALSLCRTIKYGSAGTVEFIVDDSTGEFFFLEMNTRIQVEHTVTEEIHPGLDLIKLMIQQGILERNSPSKGFSKTAPEMQQKTWDLLRDLGRSDGKHSHAIEGRVYAENPVENFTPCPGILQHVDLNFQEEWLRMESWISTGTMITPFFDPLLCKIVVTGGKREEARGRFIKALQNYKICGPTNNVGYLTAIAESDVFRDGKTTTTLLNAFEFSPRAVKVLSAGIDMQVQDLPGRTVGLGIPRSGPMDELAFRTGNILVGNPETMEGIEMVLLPGMPAVSLLFFAGGVVAVTGRKVHVTVDGKDQDMWARTVILRGENLKIEAKSREDTGGFRVYICIKGGFPHVPVYLGSKSTSVGLGGYQGRNLIAGDYLALSEEYAPTQDDLSHPRSLPSSITPNYPSDWIVYVLPGPLDDAEYVTPEGLSKFYTMKWTVSSSSNRMGIRLQSPDGSKIEWAREDGGEGGSHPSNILDNAYAPGTLNINGDTPVILTNEGPDMGGYLCLCTVATAEMWKLGQLSPGCTVQFKRVPWSTAIAMKSDISEYCDAVQNSISSENSSFQSKKLPRGYHTEVEDTPYSSILHSTSGPNGVPALGTTYRQAGDTGILVEFGIMTLDFITRARIHAFQTGVLKTKTKGLRTMCPCIRSIMCYFNPTDITQDAFLAILIKAEASIPISVSDMIFPGRRITLPIVLDDSWNREALERYMRSTRDKAVYLPSNIQYLADNNGLEGGAQEVLQKLVLSDWLVFGVGFYLACPFLVPIDPRCRLEGQKMNPSRTFTPRGAIGIAGPVAAIYPIESPGGYQLYGRTLPLWQTWGKGRDYNPDKPWLLQSFDQVHFEVIDESKYSKLEQDFDAGLYTFTIEDRTFSMAEYANLIESTKEEVADFRQKQAEAKRKVEAHEKRLLTEWEQEKLSSSSQSSDGEEADSSGERTTVSATLFASVWKIKCSRGDLVKTADDVLLILEAMKTEIPVKAGEANVGKTVKGFGQGIKEQVAVRPGDTLLILA